MATLLNVQLPGFKQVDLYFFSCLFLVTSNRSLPFLYIQTTVWLIEFFTTSRYLPTKNNRLKWALEKKMKTTLTAIIQSRVASNGRSSGYGDDLLGLMLEAWLTAERGGGERDESSLTMDEIIDECKTFFFAGHETTSHLLTWTMFLLSVYPEWQQRLRDEVLRECGQANPTADTLNKFNEVPRAWIFPIHL